MQAGMAVSQVALRPWNSPRSVVRAVRRVKSQVTRIAKERRDRYRPFIAAVLRDSGLMRDQQEEGLVSSHYPRDTRREGWS